MLWRHRHKTCQLSLFASYVDTYQSLQSSIAAGNVTVLAPSNNALSVFNATTSSAPGPIDVVLSYHLLQGLHTSTSFNPAVQILPTLLDNDTYTNVTGGQRIKAINEQGTVHFHSGVNTSASLITPNILFAGGIMHIIDSVLPIPPGATETISQADLVYLDELLQVAGSWSEAALQASAEVADQSNITYLVVNSPNFALNYTGFDNMTQQAIDGIGAYHVLDRVVAYSPLLTNGSSFPILQGERVHVTVAGGDIYVNPAKVIQRDFLTSNGVMHVLDSLLNPNDTTAKPKLTPIPPPTPSAPALAPAPPKPTPAPGLSSAAKAGIGVGVTLASILLIAAALLFWRRRRRRNSGHGSMHRSDVKRQGSPSEMPLSGRGNAGELEPNSRTYELDSKGRAHELPAMKDCRHEMESDTTARSIHTG